MAIKVKAELNDPPFLSIKAPIIIGAKKPPIVPPVLMIPIEEPIIARSNNLCGHVKIAVNVPTDTMLIKIKRIVDTIRFMEKIKPTSSKDTKMAVEMTKAFSLPRNHLDSNPPKIIVATVVHTALIARIVPT